MPGERKSVVKRSTAIKVKDFYRRHAKTLKLQLIGSEVGFNRFIREPTINRPGLALAGSYTYFAGKRIQVLGSAEFSYLHHLKPEVRKERFAELCRRRIPCLVISRGVKLDPELMAVAEKAKISVFTTPEITMKFINAATIALEWDFAPTTTEHGCMVDVLGIGILVRGKSGLGKSESVLGLIERGHSLVSDDIVHFRALEGRDLIGVPSEINRFHMEVRGIGIINIAAIYGIGRIRLEKKLDLVVTLQEWKESAHVDRIGLDRKHYPILGIRVPHITIPVAPGRDTTRLIEVAGLDQKLKGLGYDSAREFNQKLLEFMQKKL